ncbi:hypothetical protein GCM10009119_36090 [Algoriphagus jejuensis]|uniref:Transposase IS200-like domain-containing protein n=1 Tax=Algoriphagus jejuensis TaxID=419934 RepID=A0ABP3YGU3_9BACT
MTGSRIPFEEGAFYHVWTHANGTENLFREDENYRFFLSKYSLHISPMAKTFAYCLMPNHFHFMIQVRESPETECGKAFGNLLNSYSQAFNKKYGRKGSLFIQNLNRRKIESDSYYSRCVTYIHQNPSHHGFVKDFKEWKHSSWKALVSEKPTNLERQSVLEWFGGILGIAAAHEIEHDPENEWLFGK